MGQQATTRDCFGRIDYLLYRIAGVVAEVEHVAASLGEQQAQAQHMGISKVAHMHVVADAGAIGGGVIVAKDLQVRAAPTHRVEQQRDQVGFGGVIFPEPTGWVGSSSIEIAENYTRQAVGGSEVAEQLLHHPLAAAVWVDRLLRAAFADGDVLGVRNSVGGAGAGEHER